MISKHSVAIVVWDDAHGSATKDVTEAELPHAPVTMTTLGWVLRDDDKGISIACERFAEDGVDYYRGHTFVPRSLICSCTKFNLHTTKKKSANAKSYPQPDHSVPDCPPGGVSP